MQNFYDRLGEILRDKLDSDEDPFTEWEPHTGNIRRAGNAHERTPPPKQKPRRIAVPKELIKDFRVLGLPPGVPLEECKAAWKRLLLENHPDRRAQTPSEQKRSAQITSHITDSYKRILRWYETGKVL
ncbi:J domain-containing protein [Brucepastera parasyntrophica]|uniref:J domain-containing protein n=1 Tax=Brucepastera parasyntrophica TaxID=2880008 RepID=UPI00210ACF21|nr:J domain-containing protein [Brucepastera parasyntrophica]ULQ59820.1 J domain-containing protein [Brucepastera parasyntrophica]